MIGIHPLDKSRAPQRFQPADMRLNIGVWIDDPPIRAHYCEVICGPIYAVVLSREARDILIGRARFATCGVNLEDGADRCGLDAHHSSRKLDVMGAAVDTIDDQMKAIPQFIGTNPTTEQPADDRSCYRLILAMNDDLFRTALNLLARHRAMHGFDNVALLIELAEGLLHLRLQQPAASIDLLGKIKPLQHLQSRYPEMSIRIGVALISGGSRVYDTIGRFSGLPQQGTVDPGQFFLIDFAREFLLLLNRGFRTKLDRGEFRRAFADAVGEIGSGDYQVLAQFIDVADYDVRMRMASVEVIDRNPVELCRKILLDLPHQVAREGSEIR